MPIHLNGAGDQGMMFGYACNETPELMPLPISLANKLAMSLTQVRKDGTLAYLHADGKTQVTVEYDDGKPVRVAAVVVSSQHSADVELETLRQDIIDKVIKTTVPAELMDEEHGILCEPHRALCCRRSSRRQRPDRAQDHRGYIRRLCPPRRWRLLGKDPTKVDRTAAYAARWVAKNLVAAGLADKCEVAAGLRHRRGQACVRDGGYSGHRQGQR